MSLLTTDSSTVQEGALLFLAHLGIAEPPITVERVLEGLGVESHPLPTFDIDRLTPEQLKHYHALKPVRGLLSPAEQRIYFSDELSTRQYPWLIYHESGHVLIDWHREALYVDNDYRLSQRAIDQMEKEANEFAGHLQFLGTRFADESRSMPFGLGTAVDLADLFVATYESAIRHYVETREENCICLVCRVIPAAEGARTLRFQYFIKPKPSRGFWNFEFKSGHVFPLDDEVVQLLNQGVLDGASPHNGTYYSQDSKQAYQRQVFCNGHSVFVLVSTI
ncbi:MAG: ImmA/IrrE family metallo-endopeptidase [Thermomicrobiales bacterium]